MGTSPVRSIVPSRIWTKIIMITTMLTNVVSKPYMLNHSCIISLHSIILLYINNSQTGVTQYCYMMRTYKPKQSVAHLPGMTLLPWFSTSVISRAKCSLLVPRSLYRMYPYVGININFASQLCLLCVIDKCFQKEVKNKNSL